MSLKNASITLGGATYAPTGGAAVTFADTGRNSPNQCLVSVTADALNLRRDITAKVTPTQVNGLGKYSPQKGVLTFHQPILLADGSVWVNKAEVSVSFHPSSTAGNKNDLLNFICAAGSDADLTPTLTDGSLA